MKKNFVRLCALVICAVMVLGLIPANASALTLEGKKMTRHNAIEYDANRDAHYFTEFADLVEIAQAAAADPDNWYNAICENVSPMTFTSDLTIPKNLYVNFYYDVVIPADVDITLLGQLYCNDLNIQGTVTVGHFSDDGNYENDVWGYLNPWGDLNIGGTVNVNYGTLCFDIDSTVIGIENVHCEEYADISVDAYVYEETDLLEAIDIAAAANNNWRYYFYLQNENLHLSNPVTIPKNAILSVSNPDAVLTGAPITVYGDVNISAYLSDIVIENDLILQPDAYAYFFSDYTRPYSVVLNGDVTNNGYINVQAPVVVKGKLANFNSIDIMYDNLGKLTFEKADLYNDNGDYYYGSITVNSSANSFPNDAIGGLNVNDFQNVEYTTQYWGSFWYLTNYKEVGSEQPPAHTHTEVIIPAVAPTCATPGYTEGSYCGECGQVLVAPETVEPVAHTVVTTPAVAPTCLDYGCTEGAYCSVCSTVLLKQERLAPLGHDYGLGADGKPDFWDTTCDVCGAERVVDPHRPTHSMYRMYNPNSGEHFYSGSMEERLTLEAAGWKYEGIGFTFPASTGKPVYRLYDKYNTKEHMYTMDEEEKEKLISEGWVLEGIAFNSAEENEVPQFRLYNPNTTIGAYHFTADVNERDMLIEAGWVYQGIGFYSSLQ